MLKVFCRCLLLLFFALSLASAQQSVKFDTLQKTFEIKDRKLQTKGLIDYFNYRYQQYPANKLYSRKLEIQAMLLKYNIPNRKAFEYYVESIYQYRLSHISESDADLVWAIKAVNNDDYLSYSLLNFLAYRQTEEGNVIDAISSYRIAKKAAIKMNDTKLQMVEDVNISDVFYKNGFYHQSLFYLDQALNICNAYWPKVTHVKVVIYYNKCENFFRMNKQDSLRFYSGLLRTSDAKYTRVYTYQNRTTYFLYILQHQYRKAIDLLNKLQKEKTYDFDDHDLLNLGDAYFENEQPDSAKYIIDQLLSKPSQLNHPEINYHLYEELGKIAAKKGDFKMAAVNFKTALLQSKENMNRLTQVDNITSLIKVDELESYYNQKDQSYQRERSWLILAIILALLVVLVVAMFYRTIKQKRHYEKLLYTAKKEELAFINSHEVRKHLTNILGLIEVIRQSHDKEKEYLEAEAHLFDSASDLDKAIKNISDKLTE